MWWDNPYSPMGTCKKKSLGPSISFKGLPSDLSPLLSPLSENYTPTLYYTGAGGGTFQICSRKPVQCFLRGAQVPRTWGLSLFKYSIARHSLMAWWDIYISIWKNLIRSESWDKLSHHFLVSLNAVDICLLDLVMWCGNRERLWGALCPVVLFCITSCWTPEQAS